MSCSYRLRFLSLIEEFEKIPPDLAGEFSAERVAEIIGCKVKYASRLIQEWLQGRMVALTEQEKEVLNTMIV